MPTSATEYRALQQYLWDVFLLILLLFLLLSNAINTNSSELTASENKRQAETYTFIQLDTVTSWYVGDIDHETMNCHPATTVEERADMRLTCASQHHPSTWQQQ